MEPKDEVPLLSISVDSVEMRGEVYLKLVSVTAGSSSVPRLRSVNNWVTSDRTSKRK